MVNQRRVDAVSAKHGYYALINVSFLEVVFEGRKRLERKGVSPKFNNFGTRVVGDEAKTKKGLISLN